ncbi:FkbM family methyltransferase [Pectobacterium brasiliense]|uniref:FkbM family methyltransferase n=1 Tax=Pectobacterium TaxID=122277 RepID=UPI0019697399|nr:MULTISPECIES: FkbM family methyltransferase [Pectobacterium]MBN3133617.1 FkbM family methyltransferase [Pectobacterium brasiliense]UUE34836.1 FkbM family methyltransferase [Pectobacterium aroidearum]UUE39214.1 FkbM family methyltransferase [Pectobacterium aroidearum]
MLPRIHIVNSSQGSFLTFGHDAISNHLFSKDNWENWLIAVTNEYTTNFNSPVVFDLGANLGAYTIPIALLIEKNNGIVYSFEPQKTVYYQLCGNIFLNRLDNVNAMNNAIGIDNGMIEIPIPDYHKMDNIGAYSLIKTYRRNEGVEHAMSEKKDIIQMIKLDDIIPSEKVRFLKIDVEGLELDVLKGALSFLEENSFPPFSFEAWNQEWFKNNKKELLEFISHLGYKIEHIQLHDYVAHHPQGDAIVDFVRDKNNNLTSINRIK